MRNLKLNQKKYIGLNFVGEIEIKDARGFLTGEKKLSYGDEIEFESHISGASGSAILDNNGIVIEYDKSIVLTKVKFEKYGFNENSVFFIDKKVQFDNGTPLYDYRVSRIAEVLNDVVIAVKKVRND